MVVHCSNLYGKPYLASQVIEWVGRQVGCGLVDLASSALGCALDISSGRLGLAGDVTSDILG